MKSVIAGHNNLHMAAPSGHTGWVTFKVISNGMHSNATIRSDTARFTSRKLRVVRMRGVCEITRQTRVFPVTPQRKMMAKKVYSVAWIPVIAVSVEFVIGLVAREYETIFLYKSMVCFLTKLFLERE